MLDSDFLALSTTWIIANVWSGLVALVVLVGGWMLAGLLSRYVVQLLPGRLHRDPTIVPLLSQVVRYGVLLVTIIIVLGQFGVQTASILAVLGAAGLAVALALQGTLSNIAAGILLVLLRPFNVGDQIDADGIAGTVVEVGLFATQMRTAEGVFMFAPNSKLSNAKIINYTREASRVLELKFNVPRTADIGAVRQAVLAGLTSGQPEAAGQPEILVDALGDSTVTLAVRVAVSSRNWMQARADMQERLKSVLDTANGFAQPAA
ncbi:mechanosensitive ion channel domain-containing protein [Devosia sp. 1566]|uniref:mechanosensitive ion channel family protein n=1 Tax=Devosia sp. 1566 TaxID=2499144 RepID=UPI000FD9D365|nr:mechanosensitive ion channel domain-containing protein [Devosia sp. 1566]